MKLERPSTKSYICHIFVFGKSLTACLVSDSGSRGFCSPCLTVPADFLSPGWREGWLWEAHRRSDLCTETFRMSREGRSLRLSRSGQTAPAEVRRTPAVGIFSSPFHSLFLLRLLLQFSLHPSTHHPFTRPGNHQPASHPPSINMARTRKSPCTLLYHCHLHLSLCSTSWEQMDVHSCIHPPSLLHSSTPHYPLYLPTYASIHRYRVHTHVTL